MSRENYDKYDQKDLAYHAADHSIHSETMENKDPAINQHEDDSERHSHTTDHYQNDKHTSDENDTSDPFFQKNAPIAQDLDEDLNEEDEDEYDDEEEEDDDEEDDESFDNDANRRTLDETKADEDEEDY